jgi:hypothetical protein
MEGAEADELAPAARQLHPPADRLGEREAIADLVEKSGREGHALSKDAPPAARPGGP